MAPKTISPEHRQAIAEGRTQNTAVSDYLEAIDAAQPKRGRQRTADTVAGQLAATEQELAEGGHSALDRLNLFAKIESLTEELAAFDTRVDPKTLEPAFVEHAAAYGKRKGISFNAWRRAGVSPAVLNAAGIHRTA